MSANEINEAYNKAIGYLKQKRMKEAQNLLQDLLGEIGDWSLRNRLEQLQTSYQFMLQYMRQGSTDPERYVIYQRMLKDTWELADQIHIHLLEKYPTRHVQGLQKTYKYTTSQTRLKDALQALENIQDDWSVSQLFNNTQTCKALSKRHEETNRNLFLSTWGNISWTREDWEDAKLFLNSTILTSNDRSYFVSAVTLSLQEVFDPLKFSWLLLALNLKKDYQTEQRALVGIALTLLRHPNRLDLYPDLAKQLILLDEECNLGKQLNNIYFQLIRAQETEKINKRIHEAIMPEMIKSAHNFKSINPFCINTPEDLDMNPEWDKIFGNSNFENKIREINDMQQEGMDVHMGTFAQMKNFPFFSDIEHWFLPFDRNHSSVTPILGNKETESGNMLSFFLEANIFCNSDKYSLCLLVERIPEEQKNFMLTQMGGPEVQEILHDQDSYNKLIQSAASRFTLSNMYIQDLYRFYQLHPRKKEFFNPFNQHISLHTIPALKPLLGKPALMQEIADFLLKKDHTEEAFKMYEEMIHTTECTADIYQKAGFCAQKNQQYPMAITYYQQAEVRKPDHLWTNRHMATCYRLAGQFNEALTYYQKVAEVEPDSKSNIFNIGSCLMKLERYEEALNCFFKLDFMEDNHVKAWRAISWCSFICGKHEQAWKYCQKVLKMEPHADDYLNAGHIAWSLGHWEDAITSYGKALISYQSKENFLTAFQKDKDNLIAQGIKEEDIPLILDMLS